MVAVTMMGDTCDRRAAVARHVTPAALSAETSCGQLLFTELDLLLTSYNISLISFRQNITH